MSWVNDEMLEDLELRVSRMSDDVLKNFAEYHGVEVGLYLDRNSLEGAAIEARIDYLDNMQKGDDL